MGRTTAVKIFALAVTTAALVLFGPSAAQADTPTPPAPVVVTPGPVSTPPPPTTDGNNPWD